LFLFLEVVDRVDLKGVLICDGEDVKDVKDGSARVWCVDFICSAEEMDWRGTEMWRKGFGALSFCKCAIEAVGLKSQGMSTLC